MSEDRISPPKQYKDFKVPQDSNTLLKFFKERKAKDWTFSNYLESERGSISKVVHNYKICLSLLLNAEFLPKEMKNFVGRLKNEQNFERLNVEMPSSSNSIQNQYNSYDNSRMIINNESSSLTTLKRKMVENDECAVEEGREKVSKVDKVHKSNKKPRDYLRGRSLEDEVVEQPIEWSIKGYCISSKLNLYRQECKKNALNNYLDSDIEEIALNGIFFISCKNERYDIPDHIYTEMIDELKIKYAVHVNFKEVDDFQVDALRPVYKSARCNMKVARKAASDIMFDHDGYKEQMSEALLNLLKEYETPPQKKLLEDEFSKKYVEPVFSPFFKENKYNKKFGNRSESQGSKARREGEGLKSDYGMKVVYKEFNHHLLHVEVKGPNAVNDNNFHHPDFVKLSNLMKDEIDLLLLEDCPDEITVFGILVGGHNVVIYSMDLVYTHVYRLFEIGSFHLPSSINDLNRLDLAYDSLITLMELYDNSSAKCIDFMKRKACPGTPPRRRSLYVKSFRSPQKK